MGETFRRLTVRVIRQERFPDVGTQPGRYKHWSTVDVKRRTSYPDPTIDARSRQGAMAREVDRPLGSMAASSRCLTRWGSEARIPNRNRMYCNPGSADGR